MQRKINYPLLHHFFTQIQGASFEVDQCIYAPQLAVNSIYYLQNGAVRIFKNNDGKKMIKRIVIPNELFGIDGLYKQKEFLDFAETVKKDCYIISVSIEIFKSELERDHKLLKEVLQFLGNRQQILDKRLLLKAFAASEFIVIDYLEELSERVGIRIGVEMLVPMMPVHKDIASLLGVSRQTVTTILSKLRKLNLIYYNRNKLLIRDVNGKIAKYLF